MNLDFDDKNQSLLGNPISIVIDPIPNELFHCRICLEPDNEKNLISPCQCKGSMIHVHETCLNTWRISKNPVENKCGVCHQPYSTQFKNTISFRTRISDLWDMYKIYIGWIVVMVMIGNDNILDVAKFCAPLQPYIFTEFEKGQGCAIIQFYFWMSLATIPTQLAFFVCIFQYLTKKRFPLGLRITYTSILIPIDIVFFRIMPFAFLILNIGCIVAIHVYCCAGVQRIEVE